MLNVPAFGAVNRVTTRPPGERVPYKNLGGDYLFTCLVRTRPTQPTMAAYSCAATSPAAHLRRSTHKLCRPFAGTTSAPAYRPAASRHS
jgi:hypothetical protein